jgi:hypothetical protein
MRADGELRRQVGERGDQRRAPPLQRRREQLTAVHLQQVEGDEVSGVPVGLAHRARGSTSHPSLQ